MLDLDEWFQSFNAWLVGLIASQPKLKIYETGTKVLSSYPRTWEAEAGA